MLSLQMLLHQWQWRPIRNCPGRLVLVTMDRSMPLDTLLGSDTHAQIFESAAAKDKVLVVPFDGGGVISYARADGSMVHTLNTAEGFDRKLSQLGIALAPNRTE